MSEEMKRKIAAMQSEIAANAAKISAQRDIDRAALMQRAEDASKEIFEAHIAGINARCADMISKLEHMKHAL